MSAGPSIASNTGICLYAEDVFEPDVALTLEQCGDLFSRYNFGPIIHALAMLKHGTEVFLGHEPISTRGQFVHLGAMLRMLLTAEDVQRATPLCIELARGGAFIPFSDRAILATMELAGICCDRQAGQKLIADGTTSALGKVLLSMQSATLSAPFRRRIAEGKPPDAWDEKDMAELIRNHLGHNSVQMFGSCVGRFFAYWRDNSIQAHFKIRAGCTVDDWFRGVVGMVFEDYVRASYFVAAAACRFTGSVPDWKQLRVLPEQVLASVPERDREHVRHLLDLSTQDPAEIGAGRTAAGDITEFVYRSFSVTTRPFVRLTTHWIPLSQNLVLGKFLAALPHLLDESHRAAGGKNIEGTRGPFGYLLEGYLSSLFHGWFDAHPEIRVLTNYHYRDGQDTPEGDILLIAGSTAFVFEVKAKVTTRVLRSEGMFGPISALLLPSAKQTLRVADAVLRGDALSSDGTLITGITRVYPCSVVYDRVPLRPPISTRYESHFEKEIGRSVFNTEGAVMPLQFFDLETIEGWEDYLNLTPSANEVLGYLQTRSVTPWLRHGRQFPDSSAPRPRTAHGPHQRLVEASTVYFGALAEESGHTGQRAPG